MREIDSGLMGNFEPVSYEQWRARVERDLKGASFTKRLTTRTPGGLTLQPIYTRADWPGDDRAAPRGMARAGEAWDVRQRYTHPDPRVVRDQIAEDLARGARSLWLVFAGGPDDSARAGEGIVCNTAREVAELLAEAPLERVAVALEPGPQDLALAAALLAAAQERGVPEAQLTGTLGCDPLGTLARRGCLPYPISAAERSLVGLATYCDEQTPGLRAVSISTAPYHNAGASPSVELAAALSAGITYLRWLTAAGLPIDRAASQIQFSVSVGADFFGEMAKLRALRKAWARVVGACGGSAGAMHAPIQARTSVRSKTARDPWVNMLRSTTEAFSAAVGGADAIATDPFDVAIGTSDGFARRVARNAQVVLNEESHVARVADPAGGSYYVETLTDRLAELAWAGMQVIEAEGGLDASLSAGALQDRIEVQASARAVRIAKRRQAITGVSEFANLGEEAVHRPPAMAQPLAARAPAMVVGHGSGLVRSATILARQGTNLADITAGLCTSLEGPLELPRGLSARPDAAAFEQLRDRSDRHLDAQGSRPTAFLANLGSIPEHKARASFATGFLNAGGIACVDNDGFPDVATAVTAFRRIGARTAVICGSDAQYAAWIEELAPELVDAGADVIVLAGRPGDQEASYRSDGVTDFIYMGSDVLATLTSLLDRMGVEA